MRRLAGPVLEHNSRQPDGAADRLELAEPEASDTAAGAEAVAVIVRAIRLLLGTE